MLQLHQPGCWSVVEYRAIYLCRTTVHLNVRLGIMNFGWSARPIDPLATLPMPWTLPARQIHRSSC